MRELERQTARGAAWMLSYKVLDRVLALASTVVLARLLVPADFGIVAIATSLVAALELLGAFSFDLALIQRESNKCSEFDTAWTLKAGFGMLCGVATLLLASTASSTLGEPRLAPVLVWVSCIPAIAGLENIGVVAFRRELEFRREFIYFAIRRVVGVSISICLAIWLRNYWALVFGSIASQAAGVLLSYVVHPFRPRLTLAASRDLFGFSTWNVVNNVLYFLNQRIVVFVLGKDSGAASVGQFTIAQEIGNLPTTELAAPVNRALLPGFSRAQANRERLAEMYFGSVGLIAMAIIPIGVGLAAVREPFVLAIFGAQWRDAIAPIGVLALAGALVALHTSANMVLLAVGRPGLTTALTALYMAILMPALIVGIKLAGLLGAAWAYFLAATLQVPAKALVTAWVLHAPLKSYLACVWRPTIAAGAMYGVVAHIVTLEGHAASSLDAALVLMGGVVVGALTYGIAIGVLWLLAGRPASAEASVLAQLDRWWRSIHSPPQT